MQRKLILYIAMSIDGYIAKKDDNLDFLSLVEIAGEDYGHADFVKNIDTVIWGRKTFEKVLSFGEGIPYQDKNVFVISKSRKGKEGDAVFHDDVLQLVTSLKQQSGKDIYCDGGAEIATQLLNHRLFDRIIVSIIPHLLGSGIRLFKQDNIEQQVQLKSSITYPSGLVQLWYDVKNDKQAIPAIGEF